MSADCDLACAVIVDAASHAIDLFIENPKLGYSDVLDDMERVPAAVTRLQLHTDASNMSNEEKEHYLARLENAADRVRNTADILRAAAREYTASLNALVDALE